MSQSQAKIVVLPRHSLSLFPSTVQNHSATFSLQKVSTDAKPQPYNQIFTQQQPYTLYKGISIVTFQTQTSVLHVGGVDGCQSDVLRLTDSNITQRWT